MNHSFDYLNLCQADADLLDRLVDVGFELGKLDALSADETARANRMLSMLGLLDGYPVEDASYTLVDATLAQIDQYETNQSQHMRIETAEIETTSSGFRIRMPDFISVAAMVLIAASVFAMISNNSRAQSISNHCASNMAQVGFGLVRYATDHKGLTPTTEATSVASMFGGLIPTRTDADKLVEQGYCEDHHLNCPGHGGNGGGFSYQTQPAEAWEAIRKQGQLLIVLSDRNPILESMLAGQEFNPLTRSKNHGSIGQNQLRDDGSTASLKGLPVVGKDKIWILDGNKRILDIFLTH
jgi:hypothetical protein